MSDIYRRYKFYEKYFELICTETIRRGLIQYIAYIVCEYIVGKCNFHIESSSSGFGMSGVFGVCLSVLYYTINGIREQDAIFNIK